MKAAPDRPSYFRIVAEGPTTATPLERITLTALEAEREVHVLTRLCGRNSKVVVWGKNGRAISHDRLANLARAERPQAQPHDLPASSGMPTESADPEF